MNGTVRQWYENGKLKSETEYSNNLRNGRGTWFYESGNLKSIFEFRAGKLLGKWFIECDEFERCQKVFYDGFETVRNDFGWSVSKNAQIIPDQGMRVHRDRQNNVAQAVHLPLETSQNFSIETFISFESGELNSGMGLIYGFKDWDDYFYFQISANGFYRVGGMIDGINIENVKWTESKFINKGVARNRIKITKIKDKVLFTINKQVVEVLDYLRIAGNNVGFYSLKAASQILYEILEVRQDITTDEVALPSKPISKWKSSGSGFFVDPRGFIVTNFHVIEGASEIEISLPKSGKQGVFKGKVILTDRQNDLAMVRIDDPQFKATPILPYSISSSTVDVGSDVFALGYPAMSILGDEVKFTDGKISSKTGYKGDVTAYQISVPVQPGSSGGPLFDYDGRIIGVVNAKVMALDNVSYAVKSSYLLNLLDALPEPLKPPNDRSISQRPLTEKVKAVSEYVVLIKVR